MGSQTVEKWIVIPTAPAVFRMMLSGALQLSCRNEGCIILQVFDVNGDIVLPHQRMTHAVLDSGAPIKKSSITLNFDSLSDSFSYSSFTSIMKLLSLCGKDLDIENIYLSMKKESTPFRISWFSLFI